GRLAAIPVAASLVRRRWSSAVAFGAVAAIGVAAIAAINTRLYGSAFQSGYDLTDAFAMVNVLPNLRRYGSWLVSAETPFALAGLAWLLWSRRWFFCTFVAAVWIAYLVYVSWDARWDLRFLLPTSPPMPLDTALCLA